MKEWKGRTFVFRTGELDIPYSLSESSRAKYIRLIIDINGVRVVKPLKAKLDDVEKLLRAKDDWISRHYLRFQSLKNKQTPRRWDNGEMLSYLGEKIEIRMLDHPCKLPKIRCTGNSFEVRMNYNAQEDGIEDAVACAFEKWYRQAAAELFKERAVLFCRMTGLSYHQIRIKEQKTRWGSCSKKGNLNFNWKLVMAPLWVIDYVILHEICHLKYMNHSKSYWDMVARYMPEYVKAREWLKKNGRELAL